MRVITTHRSPDFDAFASCVAAKKLFDDHIIVLPSNPARNLSDFLKVYSDRFEFVWDHEFEGEITELVIVDAPSLDRIPESIRERSQGAKITVYDHHVDESPYDGMVSKVGATITILVELIREKNIPLDPTEATLFMIALYDDTGNLLFSSTTPRDLEIAKFLLENGANLDEVALYTREELTPKQMELLDKLIENARDYEVNGVPITISLIECEDFVGGMGLIVSKAWEMMGKETFIAIVKMGKKIYVIGRTGSPDVDLGSLMKDLGGGGHMRAASATITGKEIDEVLKEVLNRLHDHVVPLLRARDIMSSPVKVVLSNMTIKEVDRLMKQTGHSGFPVVEGNRLVGIVTKKAVEKAMNHGLGDRPVKSIMSTNLVVATPDTSVTRLRELMVEHAIGRIPILENGILVGIVTRSDVLRAIFGKPFKKYVMPVFQANGQIFRDVSKLLVERVDPKILNLFRLLGKFGDEVNMPVYVVGGFVRDLLLGIKNLDVDIVVEGNALEFAEYAKRFLPGKLVKHDKFMTASLFLKGGLRIDIATARLEYYESPAKLPDVEMSTIKKDLYRRDFTINAMAIKLNPKDFGLLIDFFGGYRDLKEGVIRVLHTLSFVDDPTRILRAIRFEQRFDFRIEETTERLLKQAVEEGYLERTTGPRLRQELEKIFEEKNPLKSIRRMAQFDVIKHLFPKTYYTPSMDGKMENLFRNIPWVEENFGEVDKFYAVLHVFLEFYDDESWKEVRDRYSLRRDLINEIRHVEKSAPALLEMLSERVPASFVYPLVKGVSNETICHFLAYLSGEKEELFKSYLLKIKNTKLEKINGEYLIRKGITSGKIIGEVLEKILMKKLDGDTRDEEEILEEVLASLETEG
ncbi:MULTISPECIES: CBS domain-containing protein [unclassified Thermotoga]|uniref:CBS domain-containing protein n=1 Tax=unclassified Thermotoga TaxID=2631113 RepID=UPI0005439825|nr:MULTISPECIES: CBS domain-containing protein [unclassified Thermotoga]KHC92509.1 Polynucleotide adenylyltransferase region [Thermotoga sp. TBGT1765]KHC93480.1 Polynucleotide adenylyltransferase region [Thermotoga sp. TBGT1766]